MPTDRPDAADLTAPAFGTSTDDAIAEAMAAVNAHQALPATRVANRAEAEAQLLAAWACMEHARSALLRMERGQQLAASGHVNLAQCHLAEAAAQTSNRITNIRDILSKEPA